MPRLKTDPMYAERVAALVEQEGLRPREIAPRLEAWALERGRTDAPGERTVYRFYQQYRELPEHVRREHALAVWPDAFASGALPWEAARAVLDLVRYRDQLGLLATTARQAKWFWRLRQASPDIPDDEANLLSADLATTEFLRLAGFGAEVSAATHWRLTYQPWLTDAYAAMLRTHPERPTARGGTVRGTREQVNQASQALRSETTARQRKPKGARNG